MKIQKLISLGKCLALPLLFAACSDNAGLDNLVPQEEAVHPRLVFSCEPSTRAVVEEFTTGAQIGVFVTAQGSTTTGYGGNASNMNIRYTLMGGDYWETSFNTSLEAETGDVYGYYPYQSGATSGQVTLTNGTDHLYTKSPSAISRNNPTATVTLNHLMALLKFNFDASLGTVNRIRVRNLPASGTFNVFTGQVTPSTGYANADIEASDEAFTEGYPVIPGNRLDVMVYTDQGNYVWKPTEVAESGKQYTITLSAN